MIVKKGTVVVAEGDDNLYKAYKDYDDIAQQLAYSNSDTQLLFSEWLYEEGFLDLIKGA